MRVRQAFVGVVGSLVLLSASSAGAASVDSPDPTPPAIATPSATAEASSAPARIDVGAHFGMGELAFGVDRYSFWGRSYPVEAWVGFSLTNRLALFGQFYDAHVFDPSSSFAEVTDLNLLGLGVGLKYDLTSTHLYLSGSLLFSRASFGNGVTDPNLPPYRMIVDEQTHWGGMGRLALGKDWQMSRGWRLGLEGDVVLGWMDFAWSSGGDDRMSSVRGFSLLGSASYAYDLPRTSVAGSGKVNRRSFYVEARAGVGYLWTRFGVDSVGSRSYPFGLSVGWAVGRRAVFLGDVSYAPLPNLRTDVYPELESGRLYTAGPRVKYYLTPSGLFLSGALLVSRIDFRYQSRRDSRCSPLPASIERRHGLVLGVEHDVQQANSDGELDPAAVVAHSARLLPLDQLDGDGLTETL
jgi:hypothetical protein